MCRKLTYLISFVLVLGLVGGADAAEPFREFGGMVVMEGENFMGSDGRTDENQYQWRVGTDIPGYVGTGYVDTPGPQGTNGTWANACELTYQINFSTAGTYNIWLRRYTLDGASNSVWVGLDGQQMGSNDNTADYNVWIWKNLGTMNVTAGSHVFNLRRREAAYKVDRIVLTTNSAYIPSGEGPVPIATNPNPADGATGVLIPLLQWTVGYTASFHDVYFGTNPTPGAAEFRGRQPFAMYWHGPGLIPGTTYYWRVDEVEADGVTVHTGDVWSFTSAPRTAYNPNPTDGAKLVDTEADISWTAGVGAVAHDVYIGTNQADVAAGTGDTFKGNQAATKYDPGTLARGATYYWRIDEVDSAGTKHTGDLWRFRTIPIIPVTDPSLLGWWKLDEGFGTMAIDWSGHENHGTIYNPAAGLGPGGSVWDIDPEYGTVISFNGDNTSGAYISAGRIPAMTLTNGFTWTLWAKQDGDGTGIDDVIVGNRYGGTASPLQFIKFTPRRFEYYNDDTNYTTTITYTVPIPGGEWLHHAAVKDGASLTYYRNGVRSQSSTITKTIDANPFFMGGDAAGERWRGWLSNVRIYDRVLTAEEVKKTMIADPTLAWNPKPADKSTTDVEKALPMSWTPGESAAKHDVYLGTDALAVEAADTSDTTGIYRGRQDPNSFSPPAGVEFGKTYYWRIDEFNTDGTISTGKIWSFTVADYLIVDDFEAYNDDTNKIFDVWADYFVNNTGATVGYFDPPFAEQTIVHSGSQSMPMRYDNDGTVNEGTAYEKTGTKFYSEAEREWSAPQDWTRKGVASLRLYLQGAAVRFADAAGTITMSAAGADIWGTSDQFRYAYKQFNGDGQIVAKVVSIGGPGTNEWRKAGVMIREGLDAGSRHAFMAITPAVAHGIAFQNRPTVNGSSVSAHYDVGLTAPCWVKLVRQGAQFTGYYSTNGVNWIQVPSRTASDGSPNPQTIAMSPNAYIGLALTSHQSGVLCVAQFSDVTITGATGPWTIADIGVAQPGNDPAPMYVVLQDSANKTAVVTHSDPAATLLDSWQEWNIALTPAEGGSDPVQGFALAGLNLRAIKKLSIGVGDRANPQRGGSGRLYIDDIQLRLPPPAQ